MKIIPALLVASASAFAPSTSKVSKTSLNGDARSPDGLGVDPGPLDLFDPLGFVDDVDSFPRRRAVEIKHGRISQLAFLGQIVTRNGIHLGGDIDFSGDSFDSFPNGLAAIYGPDAIPGAGLAQIVAFVGFLELGVMKDSANGAEPGEFVGDFRNGALDFGWDTFDEETKLSKRAIELNNGRAAMFGILGLMVHEEIIPLGYDPDLPIIGHL